jgi:hypothetical protein
MIIWILIDFTFIKKLNNNHAWISNICQRSYIAQWSDLISEVGTDQHEWTISYREGYGSLRDHRDLSVEYCIR